MILIDPDCRDGKHANCRGYGWDTDTDTPTDCPCSCHPKETTMSVITATKKPIEIRAIQLTPLNIEEVEAFVGGDFGTDAVGDPVIATLEGAMHVSMGDYVIRGVQGEFYPCKPDIFAQTYDIKES